jgi:hypothetical protein
MFGLFGQGGMFGGRGPSFDAGSGYRRQAGGVPSFAEEGGKPLDGRALDYSWMEDYLGGGAKQWGFGGVGNVGQFGNAGSGNNNPMGDLLDRLKSGDVPRSLALRLGDPQGGAQMLGLTTSPLRGPNINNRMSGQGLMGVMDSLKRWDAGKLEQDPKPQRPQWQPPDPSQATAFGNYSLPENTQAHPMAYLG